MPVTASLRILAQFTKSSVGQSVLHLRTPELDSCLLENDCLDPEIWKEIWRKRKDAESVFKLVRTAYTVEQKEMVLARERRLSVLRSFLYYLELTGEQKAFLVSKVNFTLEDIERMQSYGHNHRRHRDSLKTQKSYWLPNQIEESREVFLDYSYYKYGEMEPATRLLETELDRMGRPAWETAVTLMTGPFSGSVDELLSIAERL